MSLHDSQVLRRPRVKQTILRNCARLSLALSATLWVVGYFHYSELYVANPVGTGNLHFRAGSDGIAIGRDSSVSLVSIASVASYPHSQSPDFLGWRPRYFSYGLYTSVFVPHWITTCVAIALLLLCRFPIRFRHRRPRSNQTAFCLSDYPQLQSIVIQRKPSPDDTAS